jgi:hypothetical protein
MTQTLPSRTDLKQQAKALRAGLTARGTAISHSEALELIAHQWGAADWNTLSARVNATPPARWSPGDTVKGAYLGHRFTGKIKAVRALAGGFWDLTIRFDTPVDVVASDQFSALRRQVSATINATGRTVQKISNGTPHLAIDM